MLKSRNLIQPEDFTVEEIDEVLALGQRIMKNPEKYIHVCDGKLLATLFYEPSTRTRLSFESAMNRLGGRIVGFSDPKASSTAKGETLQDTMRIVSFINAGDGGNQHPTQTLTDLLTIKTLKGNLSGHTVGLCGDLKYGRTVHSLVKAMSRYPDTKFVFIAPDELKMPDSVKEAIKGHEFVETNDLESAIPGLDILYMTRVQRERFDDIEEYERLKDTYILNKEKLTDAKEDMLILHPLPRVNEISTDVDDDKRAVYFEQAKFGMYVRMALIMKLLGIKDPE